MNNLVTLMSGKAVTTSLKIAEVFGKQHKNVLQSIDNLKSQLPAEWHKLNFQPTQIERKTPTGGIVKSKMYFITRDGFTLLAMGFTGKRAMQFKLAYIAAFNAMEAELAARHNAPEPAPLDLLRQHNRLVNSRFSSVLSAHRDVKEERKEKERRTKTNSGKHPTTRAT